MRRYLEVYRLMLRNSLVREMSFKANFLMWIVVECLWFVGQIIFLEVMFSHVNAIGGWTKWECILLVGTHQIVAQVFQGLFFVNLSELPDLVRTGRLDLMLLLPIDSQFAVSNRKFGLDSFVSSLVSVAIVAFAVHQLKLSPTPAQLGLYVVCLGLGLGIHYSILFTLATLSIWIIRAQGLIYGYFNVFNVARQPDTIFRGLFKFVFSWLIPVIIVANVPARVLARAAENPWPHIAHLAAATVIVVLGARAFWFYALRHYGSASS